MPRVEVSEELYNRLLLSQAENLRGQLDPKYLSTCDDGGDYLMSSLDIMHTLVDLAFQEQPDLGKLDVWLNTPPPKLGADGFWPHGSEFIELLPGYRVVRLGACAGDGVGDEFAKLNCPALSEDN